MALSKYNKDRPFLMVDLIRMPPKGSPTHKKNYGTEGEWQLGEQISIEDVVKDKHLIQSAVIVDILKAKLIKNRTDMPDTEVLQYLVNKYKKEITEGIQIWMHKKGMIITPQQINKIEENIDKPDIIALTLEEGDSTNIADMVTGTTVEEYVEENEKKKRTKKVTLETTSDEQKPKKRTTRKAAENTSEEDSAEIKPKRTRKKVEHNE